MAVIPTRPLTTRHHHPAAARLTDRTWGLSIFGGFDMKPSRRDSFKALITDWLGDLTMSINYSLVDRSGSVPDPTSPPTSQVLQTYPYQTTKLKNLVTIEVSEPVEGLGTVGGGNMLLYLGMTKGQSMPEGGLPWKANWVPRGLASNPTAGCLAISREDLIDNFLMPHLTIINRATYFEMTEAHTKKTGAAKAEYRFNIGQRALADSAFHWTKSVVEGETRYSWTKTSSMSDEDGKRGFKCKASGKSKHATLSP